MIQPSLFRPSKKHYFNVLRTSDIPDALVYRQFLEDSIAYAKFIGMSDDNLRIFQCALDRNLIEIDWIQIMTNHNNPDYTVCTIDLSRECPNIKTTCLPKSTPNIQTHK